MKKHHLHFIPVFTSRFVVPALDPHSERSLVPLDYMSLGRRFPTIFLHVPSRTKSRERHWVLSSLQTDHEMATQREAPSCGSAPASSHFITTPVWQGPQLPLLCPRPQHLHSLSCRGGRTHSCSGGRNLKLQSEQGMGQEGVMRSPSPNPKTPKMTGSEVMIESGSLRPRGNRSPTTALN